MSMYSNPLVPPPEVPASVPKPYARVLQAETFNKTCSQSMRSGSDYPKAILVDAREDDNLSSQDEHEVSYKDIHIQYPNFPLFRQNLSSSVHGFNTFSSYDCSG